MPCLFVPLHSASGRGIFQWVPYGIIRQGSLGPQNALRAPFPDCCSVMLIDVPASPGGWTVEGAGPRVRRPWVGSQLCHRVWPAQLPPWAAAVSSLAKQEDWTNPQAGLKSLTVSRPLELYHPGSCQKLGPPILSQQVLRSHPQRGLRGRGCPACGGGVSLRGRAQVSGSLQGLIPGAVGAETLGRALPCLTLALVSS